MTRLILLDDQVQSRARRRRLLSADPDFTIVAEPQSWREAPDSLTQGNCEIVLISTELRWVEPLEVLWWIPTGARPCFIGSLTAAQRADFEDAGIDYEIESTIAAQVTAWLARLKFHRAAAVRVVPGKVGLTADLIHHLARMPDLRVAALTPSFYFKHRPVLIRAGPSRWASP